MLPRSRKLPSSGNEDHSCTLLQFHGQVVGMGAYGWATLWTFRICGSHVGRLCQVGNDAASWCPYQLHLQSCALISGLTIYGVPLILCSSLRSILCVPFCLRCFFSSETNYQLSCFWFFRQFEVFNRSQQLNIHFLVFLCHSAFSRYYKSYIHLGCILNIQFPCN